MRDLALARLEGEKERGGEVQVRNLGVRTILVEKLCVRDKTMVMFRRGCERD